MIIVSILEVNILAIAELPRWQLSRKYWDVVRALVAVLCIQWYIRPVSNCLLSLTVTSVQNFTMLEFASFTWGSICLSNMFSVLATSNSFKLTFYTVNYVSHEFTSFVTFCLVLIRTCTYGQSYVYTQQPFACFCWMLFLFPNVFERTLSLVQL